MVLATHAIVGGALAGALRTNPLAALIIGIASHYGLDYLPHWDYYLESSVKDSQNPLNNDMIGGRPFYRDLVKLSLDAVGGLFLAWYFFTTAYQPAAWLPVLAGAIGGLLPDFFQFVYMKIRREPFSAIQKIHIKCHSSNEELKTRSSLGIFLQVTIIIVALLVGNWRFFF